MAEYIEGFHTHLEDHSLFDWGILVEGDVERYFFGPSHRAAMRSLQAYVEGSASFLPTCFDEAYRTMKAVEAIYEASYRGGELIVWDVLKSD